MGSASVPVWLNGKFLKSCLESDSENFSNVNVTEYTVEPAVTPGNNYGSQLMRIKVQYTMSNKATVEESTSLIVKTPLNAGYVEASISMCDKESMYYSDFIPETYNICKHSLVPKAYISPTSQCVVMEDLKMSGYEMVDRRKLLDLEHAKMFIKASAKLQALSVAVHKKDPILVEGIGVDNPETTERFSKISKNMLRKGLICLAVICKENPNHKHYVDIIEQLIIDDNLWNYNNELENLEWKLKSLAQLDPWCANMMFKYDSDGNVIAVKLLDFQMMTFTSPLFEFFTFIWGSVHPDLRKVEFNNLCILYCDSLNENLTELGCTEKLSLQQLMSSMIEFSPLLFKIVCWALPFSLYEGVADENEYLTAELDMEFVKESALIKMFQGPLFNSLLPKVLKEFEEIGVFTYLREKLEQTQQNSIGQLGMSIWTC